MTHPIYSQSALSALSLADIKAIANQIGAICDGDKRSKQVWIAAIVTHQSQFSPEVVAAWDEHVTTVASRQAAPDAESDNYVPTPRTHADDVAFAAAMGCSYDDVFGASPDAEPATEEEIEWEIAQEMGKEGFYDLPDAEIEPESGDIFGGYGDIDESDYPDMPTHAEQEAIAHAADRLAENTHRGAVTVVLGAIVLLIIAGRSLLEGTCAIVRGAILLASMFGSYNPDLDFWWQFQQRAKVPAPMSRLSPALAVAR